MPLQVSDKVIWFYATDNDNNCMEYKWLCKLRANNLIIKSVQSNLYNFMFWCPQNVKSRVSMKPYKVLSYQSLIRIILNSDERLKPI